MSFEDEFDDPGSGSLFVNADNEGKLLLVYPHEFQSEFTTQAGTGPAVFGRIVVLDGPEAPVEYDNAIMFGKVLTGQLRSNAGTGRANLGRLGKGEKKPGQSAPWVLAKANEDDKNLARKYVNGAQATRAAADAPPF